MSNQNIQCHNAVLAALGANVSAQSVKTNFGHDRTGAMCTVLLNGKKAFEFHDDGWGGDAEVNPLNEAVYQSLTALVTEKNIAKVLFENGWSFMVDEEDRTRVTFEGGQLVVEGVAKISLHTVMENVADALIYKHTRDAALKKIMKRTEKAFVIIDGDQESYMEFGFKGSIPLADVKKNPKGLEYLTRRHADALAKAKEKGMTLLNTPEQLAALGLKA